MFYFILSYIDNFLYWYTSEILGKWFVDTLGMTLHVNLFGYSHWLMTIVISQMKDHYISVDQDIYTTSIVEKYLDTDTVKRSTKFYNTILSSDMIFTKADASTSDDQVDKSTRELDIHYRAYILLFYYIID